MARPLVLVYQEYASLSFTPANADLNTCVAAVAKHIREFSNAADRTASTYTKPVKDQQGAVTFDDVFVDGKGMRPDSIPGGFPGMVIESGAVYLPQAELLVDMGNCSVTTDQHVLLFTDLPPVMAGDQVVLEYTENAVSKKMTTFIREMDRDAKTVTVRDSGLPASDPSASPPVIQTVSYTITRIADAKVSTVNHGLSIQQGSSTFGLGNQSVDDDSGCTILAAKKAIFEYVARRTDLNYVQDITSAADVVAKLGKIDARNPLAVAAYMAVSNAGTAIKAYGVTDDTVEAFGEFETAIASRADIYCVVPVSHNVAGPVVASLKNRFENQANVDYALENGTPQRFRMVVAGGPDFTPSLEKMLVSYSSNVSGGAVSGGKATITVSNGEFVTKGVRAGDKASYAGSSTPYVIDAVISNQQIRINVSAGSIPGGGPLVVSRTMTVSEATAEYVALPSGYGSKRCVLVAGRSVDLDGVTGGTDQSTAYLACAVGGMIAGLPPHQGLTNLAISGVKTIYGTQDTFSDAQLSKLSDGGWCVFIQESASAAPFCIHGVTTDPSAIEFSEIMSVKNFDYVSESLARQLDRFIGTWNLNDETLGFIRQALEGKLADLKSRKLAKIGAPVIDASITSAGTSAISADRAEIFVELTLPKSLNTIGLHLVSR